MSEPSSQYLTHMHEAWQGCNVFEIAIISGFYLVLDLCVSLALSICYGYFLAFLLGLFILTVTVLIKHTCAYYGKYKEGKPPGVVSLQIRSLGKYFGFKQKKVTRAGVWSTGRQL